MAHKFDTTKIREAQDAFFSPELGERVAALRKMMVWYEGESPLVRTSLDDDQKKAQARALAIRDRAMDARTPLEEADTAARMALKFWERVFSGQNLPRVKPVETLVIEFEMKRAKLEAKAAATQAKYAPLAAFCKQYFPGLGVKVDPTDTKERKIQPVTKMMVYSEAFADALLAKLASNPSEVLFEEFPYWVKLAAATFDANGQPRVDANLLSTETARILRQVTLAAPNPPQVPVTFPQPAVRVPRATTAAAMGFGTPTSTPRAPKPAPAPRAVPTGGFLFRPGTTMAKIFEVLERNSQISVSDAAALGAADPRRMLGNMGDKLSAMGKGSLVKKGDIFVWTPCQ